MSACGNPQGSCPTTVAFTTAENGIELLMDVTNGLTDVRDRLNARAFGAVHSPAERPEVRPVLEELLGVLDRTSAEGCSDPLPRE